MIISGVDRYIASWFNVMHKVQKQFTVNVHQLTNCSSSFGAPQTTVYYYIYSVSISDDGIKVVFVTDSTATPATIASLSFFGAYSYLPTVCVNAYQSVSNNLPLAVFQLITVFHV